MGISVHITAMVWFRRGDYARLIGLFKDGDKFPRSYDEWLAKAETGRRGLEAQGVNVVAIHIDPDEFPVWCAEHGHDLNGQGRNAFASWAAYRLSGGDQGCGAVH